ncbi:tyrosine-protein phosphatase [Streptomyces sp. NPDC048404]|uniref:tyrosine-protein phosphatase n=1 Tax=unclassified Streptomyces TaxID=2593676 RepID=UPI00342AF4D1
MPPPECPNSGRPYATRPSRPCVQVPYVAHRNTPRGDHHDRGTERRPDPRAAGWVVARGGAHGRRHRARAARRRPAVVRPGPAARRLPALGRPADQARPRPEYLGSGFDEVRAKYGDFPSYLNDGLHIDAREPRDLKRELLAG